VLVDHRTYRAKPGRLQAQLDLYEKYGYPVQVRHLGEPIAFLVSESGELNTMVHLWGYADATDRATRRAKMMADPDWPVFMRETAEAGFVVDQRTNLMVPVSFAPLPAVRDQ